MPQSRSAVATSSDNTTASELLLSSELRLLAVHLREYKPICLIELLQEAANANAEFTPGASAVEGSEAVSIREAGPTGSQAPVGRGTKEQVHVTVATAANHRGGGATVFAAAVDAGPRRDGGEAAVRAGAAPATTAAAAPVAAASTVTTAEAEFSTELAAEAVHGTAHLTGGFVPERTTGSGRTDSDGAAEVTSSNTAMSAGAATVGKVVKNAAVLVPLFFNAARGGEVRVWLTKRASKLSSHSGEVSLPGGKREAADVDDEATALREAHEEIGLKPSEVVVVARLEPFLSKHLLTVTPVVGLLPHGSTFQPQVNESEVEAAFSAPLDMFLEDKSSHTFKDTSWMELPYRVHYFDHDTDDGRGRFMVWGLTAAILIRTASVVYKRKPQFGEFHPDAPSYEEALKQLAMRRLLHV